MYADTFSRQTTRYIHWQLELAYPERAERVDFEIEAVYYSPSGREWVRDTVGSFMDLGWDSSWQTKRVGWPESGNWKTGSYWLELSVDSQLIASGGFEIVSRRLPAATPRPTLRPAATLQPTPSPTPTPEPLMSYWEVIDLVHPSIVRIVTGDGSGSGFIIRTLENSAYVATNEHVVENAASTVSAVVGDRAIYPGIVTGKDDRYDFAVVWICCSDEFKALPLAEDGSYVSGDEVGAFGYPLRADEMQATWGNFHRLDAEPDENGWDMENRPLNTAGGNSGGPLMNRAGFVVGVHAGSARNQPFANGVSASAIRELLPELIGDHTPDKRNWPAVDWKQGVSVTHDGLLELDVKIRQSSFMACDGNTPIGQVCNQNVIVYVNGARFRAVQGYYCGEGSKGKTTWCMDSSGEEHFYYPSSGRLSVRVLTNLTDLYEDWKDRDYRWEVCVHSNTEEHPLLGCSPIEWKGR